METIPSGPNHSASWKSTSFSPFEITKRRETTPSSLRPICHHSKIGNSQSNKETYTPSTDAKPRTRRRSGGFKTEHAPVQSGIGEVDPKDALKGEKLSGRPEPEIKKLVKKVAKKDSPRPAAKKEQAEEPKTAPKESTSTAEPRPETLAAIQRVEGRIAERRKERDAKRAEREKSPGENCKESTRKEAAYQEISEEGQKNKGGLISSILKFFGLGPKDPSRSHADQSTRVAVTVARGVTAHKAKAETTVAAKDVDAAAKAHVKVDAATTNPSPKPQHTSLPTPNSSLLTS